MMNSTTPNTIVLLTALTILISCGRIKDKTHELTSTATQKIKEKSADFTDKAFPHFDAYKPDTKFNKLRFKEFFQVELTPDIRNLYCYGDEMGIDADYQFSFNCTEETAKRIIEKQKLKPGTENAGFTDGLQHDFSWWDRKKIRLLKPYSWKGDHEWYKYFWYDSKNQKAYYFEFDM